MVNLVEQGTEGYISGQAKTVLDRGADDWEMGRLREAMGGGQIRESEHRLWLESICVPKSEPLYLNEVPWQYPRQNHLGAKLVSSFVWRYQVDS